MVSMGTLHWDFKLCFPPCSNTQEGLRHSEDAFKAGKQVEDLIASEIG